MDGLLDDNILIDDDIIQHEIAGSIYRLINYIIDSTIIIICFFLVLILIILTPLEGFIFTNPNQDINSTWFGEYCIYSILAVTYYTISEYFFKGKTIGKYFTDTRAVSLTGHPMDFDTILRRSLFRIIPFEALSFIWDSTSGWHDKWTETKVILDRNWKEKIY